MATQSELDLLNDLILVSEDGEQGFQQAALLARDHKLTQLFEECAQECHIAARELQEQVVTLGGRPAEGGSISGAAHRGWMLARSVVSVSDLSVLEEVERGEDQAKAMYSKALTSDLPAYLRELVQRQADGTIRNHNRIRALRDSLRQSLS